MFKVGDKVKVVNRRDHWDGMTGTIRKLPRHAGDVYILDMDDYPENVGRSEFPYAHFFSNKLELLREVVTTVELIENYEVD